VPDKSLNGSENLLEPDVLTAQIIDDLKAALLNFAGIQADLAFK
jgi:hypothetical protein